MPGISLSTIRMIEPMLSGLQQLSPSKHTNKTVTQYDNTFKIKSMTMLVFQSHKMSTKDYINVQKSSHIDTAQISLVCCKLF